MTRVLLASLLAALALARPASADDRLYDGSRGQLAVDMPRVEEAEVRIDGDLAEPIWQEAAILTGFTQMEPVEGGAASERTEVLLFYTPRALYIGVRAYASNPARIRATLAERDKIVRDDHIQILLDTFLDRRRAYALYVNPLGIQQDGIYNEAGGRRREERADFSPDFLYQSRGRLTPEGYTLEIRVPFKSLKFASGRTQRWGINVIRHIAATGAEEAWAPISRSNPSRLAQSGTLETLHDLRPGTLFEANPTLTGKRDGSLQEGVFRRSGFVPDMGLNLKYGLTSNLTLDATLNPDFSQIEADADQITTNERFAILFPEKRPFFLEGAEIFAMPEPLVYTRAIVNPMAGAKLNGKVGPFSIGYLGALDESPLTGGTFTYAPDPQQAFFNIVRLQRDIGTGSSLGVVLTDREAGEEFNRVVGVDGRVRFRNIYTWQFQTAGSSTRFWAPHAEASDSAEISGQQIAVAPREQMGHMVLISLDRSGRNYGFRMQVKDLPNEFRAQSGFLRRTGVTDLFAFHRLTFFGQPGALIESWGPNLFGNRIYGARSFWEGGGAEEGAANLRMNLNLRGNNRVAFGYSNRFFVLNPNRYAAYSFLDGDGVMRTGLDAITPDREMRGLDGLFLEASSAYFKTISAGAEVRWDQTPIFAEGTRGTEWSARGEVLLRPTDALRLEATLRHAWIYRERDGSLYSRATLPRLKAEYQLTRSMFVRAIGQYSLEEVDLLRAPDGTPYLLSEQQLRFRRGRNVAASELQRNPLRFDLLFSYQPSPGTVVFLGYGQEMTDNEAFQFSPLERRADGLFFKLSYLFRN